MGKPLELPFDPIDRAARIWEARFGPSPSMAAVTSIMRAQQILLGELDALLRPYELTFARYEALVLLTFSRRGALPLRVIGERLMVHPTSVTNIISRLERQHLVERRPNPADGRGRLAEITPAGRAVVERATRDLMAAEFGLGGYGPGQLKEIFDLLRGLRLTNGDFLPEKTGEVLGDPRRRPALPAVEGEPDRPGRGVGGQRDALAVGRHAHVAEPAGRRRPLQRRLLPGRAARPARTSIPWLVARTSVPAGRGGHRGGQARAGAAAAFCQMVPPSAEVKICLACWPPGTLDDVQARIRFAAFAAASSAPVGWPSASGVPTGQGTCLTACQGALPSTGPA